MKAPLLKAWICLEILTVIYTVWSIASGHISISDYRTDENGTTVTISISE